MMRIILASGSKQRRDVLDLIGLKYEVIKSNAEEECSEKEPGKYVEQLSIVKAKSVAEELKENAIIIAADTIIYFNGKVYEKPKTKKEAFDNLKELSGKMNSAYTGITIIDLYQNKTISFSSKVDVYFRNISDKDIEWYVNNESRILDCCGYVVLGKASLFVDKVDGDYNTLFGISPSILYENLKKLGYSISDFELQD
ncbi:MAG: Maf family nucleotide pyrophosphatase [Clostridia bacterium]|nr:Maf family nucleotide pyrophosphatase [Clostridia bacterium]